MDGELLKIGHGGIVPVQWSAEKSDDPGTLTGWAAVYNVVDQQEDVLVAGAMSKTMKEWRASKRVIPLTADHENDVDGVIGSLAAAEDTPFGLKTRFKFSSTARAQDARTKAMEGHLAGLSIFGPIINKAFSMVDGRAVRILKEVGLMSVGLTALPANLQATVLAAKAATASKVSDTPWSNFSEADYSDEQWRRACIVDKGTGEGKSRYALPVREPSGALNRNAVHAAAGRLNQVSGISPEQKAKAARTLVRLYGELGEDPPDSLRSVAGVASSLVLPDTWIDDMRTALAITVPTARKAAVDELVIAQYGTTVATGPDETHDKPDADDGHHVSDVDTWTVDDEKDAAGYALSVIGESGPSTDSPGGEPENYPLADLIASSSDASKTAMELDQLAQEIEADMTGDSDVDRLAADIQSGMG